MDQFNAKVQSVINKITDAQSVIAKMFNISTNICTVTNISDKYWQYNPKTGILVYGSTKEDIQSLNDNTNSVAVQFVTNAIGDYCLVNANENILATRNTRGWENAGYFVVNKNMEVK